MDTGVGIAPEDQEAVFEEFRQVGTADKKVEGTGLGLALSRKFIELHGGQDLGEEPGRGRLDVHVHDPPTSWRMRERWATSTLTLPAGCPPDRHQPRAHDV